MERERGVEDERKKIIIFCDPVNRIGVVFTCTTSSCYNLQCTNIYTQ